MMSINKENVIVPLDITKAIRETCAKNDIEAVINCTEVMRRTDRPMLFAGDQKAEHINDGFYRKGGPENNYDPERFSRIATQLGLIARYRMDDKDMH